MEGLGYDHILSFDHILGFRDDPPERFFGPLGTDAPMDESLVLFGFLAALTRRVELVTGVLVSPVRQTALLAKQATEIDILTRGRLRLGLGIGWVPRESAALHEDYATRAPRIEEQMAVMRELWTEDPVDFNGQWHDHRLWHVHALRRSMMIRRPRIRATLTTAAATAAATALSLTGPLGVSAAPAAREHITVLSRAVSNPTQLYSAGGKVFVADEVAGTVSRLDGDILMPVVRHVIGLLGVAVDPYGRVAYTSAGGVGRLTVVNPGGNDILKVSPTGKVSLVTVLPRQATLITAAVAKENDLAKCTIGVTYYSEAMPTHLQFGANGTLYVSTLSGEIARGTVYTVDVKTGRDTLLTGGFVGATNLAVTPRGVIYVANLYAGTISRIHGGKVTTVAALKNVLSLTFDKGALYAGTVAPGLIGDGPSTEPGSLVRVSF